MAVKHNIGFKENDIYNSSNVQSEGKKKKIIQYTKSMQDHPKYPQKQARDNVGHKEESSAYRAMNRQSTTVIAHCKDLEDKLERLWKELQSVKTELTTVKHDLIEVKEASETHIKALQEFNVINNICTIYADGVAVPMKPPTPPMVMMTAKKQPNQAKPSDLSCRTLT